MAKVGAIAPRFLGKTYKKHLCADLTLNLGATQDPAITDSGSIVRPQNFG